MPDNERPFGGVDSSRLRAMVARPDATFRNTLRCIDDGAAGVCLVCEGDRFVGLLSDGDVRRALLAGASLEDPIAPHLKLTTLLARPADLRDAVLDSMRARRLDAVPILDSNQRLVGLHVLRELIGLESRDNVVIVMAGGKGTRLGSLTESTPKPMLAVAGTPILERIVQKLVGQGFTKFAISVNYLADAIIEHFGSGEAYGCEITYLRESPDRPLGTGGSLSLLRECGIEPELPIVVLNGDVLSDAPLGELLQQHEDAANHLTISLSSYEHTVPFGVVETNEGQVVRLIEKPTNRWSVNAGIYAISPSLLHAVPQDRDFPIVDLVDIARAQSKRVGVFELPGAWLDIGRPSELRTARGEE